MKNFLKTFLFAAAFVCGGILFQISCSNSDEENFLDTSQLNKIIFTKGVGEFQTLWTCNYDGSNLTQIPIALPPNVAFNGNNGNAYPRVSPDGQTIFFVCVDNSDFSYALYSCDISGNNLQEVYNSGPALEAPTNPVIALGSAY